MPLGRGAWRGAVALRADPVGLLGLGRDDQSFELGDVDLHGVALAFDHAAVIELGQGGYTHRGEGGGPVAAASPISLRGRGRGLI